MRESGCFGEVNLGIHVMVMLLLSETIKIEREG